MRRTCMLVVVLGLAPGALAAQEFIKVPSGDGTSPTGSAWGGGAGSATTATETAPSAAGGETATAPEPPADSATGTATAAVAPSGTIGIPGVKSLKPTRHAPPPAEPTTADDGFPLFKPGEVLPNQYLMLFNPGRYGLPAPKDGWVYFSVGTSIYRANLNSRIVLERMAQTTQ